MRWNYEKDIDFSKIKKDNIKDNEFLFYLITIASFIEITSDVYAKNLSKFFSDNTEAVEWLQHKWEKEEVQHGKALKKYIKNVWSDFDWEKAYQLFLKEYLPLCGGEQYQPTKAREMLARMVVETGTSTFYRAVEAYASEFDEPILVEITHNIYKDELDHYSYFDKFFKLYNENKENKKGDIVKVVYSRLKEVNDEDAYLAFDAIFEIKNSSKSDRKDYEEFKKTINKFAKKYYPYNMSIKMLLHPISLNKVLAKAMVPTIKGAIKILGI